MCSGLALKDAEWKEQGLRITILAKHFAVVFKFILSMGRICAIYSLEILGDPTTLEWF